jgi:hypothetical protein
VPGDVEPTPTRDVTLRGLVQAERVVLGFPLAFFPPFIVAVALAHSEPAAAGAAITLAGTAVLWATLSLRSSIRFTADALELGLTFGRRRIPWADIRDVTYYDVTGSDTDEVHHRLISVRYRRDPQRDPPPMPTRFGEFRQWNKEHFRTVHLPLSFPAPPSASRRQERDARLTRRRRHQRQVILREFAARGYHLPE